MGRATSQAYRHHPFFWSIDEDDHLEIMFTEFFSEFYVRGYNVIDPTCMFFDGNDLVFGLACSELDWGTFTKTVSFSDRHPKLKTRKPETKSDKVSAETREKPKRMACQT